MHSRSAMRNAMTHSNRRRASEDFKMQMLVSAAQAIVDSLIQHGVDVIFGIPGVHTYKLFDALYERRREIRFIGTRHEQGAAYMAYGYAAGCLQGHVSRGWSAEAVPMPC